MQRMWMRGLIFMAVGALSVFLTGEADAQGPVRRMLGRVTRRDSVAANTNVRTSNSGMFNRDGFIARRRTTTDRVQVATGSQVIESRRGPGILGRNRIDQNVVPATAIEDTGASAAGGTATPREAPATPATPNGTPPRTP